MLKRFYKDNSDWQAFFSHQELFDFLRQHVEETWIPSLDTEIHLDIYPQQRAAPTIVYLHGLSSCGRMMGHLAKPLFDRGYNVVCPDFVGFGMTSRKYGSGTIDEFIQNTLDTIDFVRKNFSGPVYLSGISMGGGMAYYGAAAGAPVEAIACFCLLDFGNPMTWSINSKGPWLWGLMPLLWLGRVCLPQVYIPMRTFLDPQRLCDDAQIVSLFKTSPLTVHHYTFKAALSILHTKPLIPMAQFDRVPVLVLHAHQDRLIPEQISQFYYQMLPGKKKFVSIPDCGHVPVTREQVEFHAQALDQWFRQYS